MAALNGAGDAYEPAPSVVAALERTVHRVLEMLAADLKDLGLTQGEVNALAQLDPRRGCTVADLQAATGQRASDDHRHRRPTGAARPGEEGLNPRPPPLVQAHAHAGGEEGA